MGFTHVTRLGHMTGFISFDLFLVRGAVDS